MSGQPRIKLSEDVEKVTMPGKKDVYRLFGADGNALVDLLQQPGEEPPLPNQRVLVRHPFQVRLAYCVMPLHVFLGFDCIDTGLKSVCTWLSLCCRNRSART